MKKIIKLSILPLFLLFLGGLYISSTSSFRAALVDYYIQKQAYDKVIDIGEKIIRKERLEKEIHNISGKSSYSEKMHKLLARIYANKKKWFYAAKNISGQKTKDFLKLDNDIDNYALGSFLLALSEYAEAEKYFKRALIIAPDLLDARRKLNICSGNELPEKAVDDMAYIAIENTIPNAGFEITDKIDKTKPENWHYLSSCGIREKDPWGLSSESHIGNYACYLEQFYGKNAWVFSGIAHYKYMPSDDYVLFPDTAYQVSLWAKADNEVTLSVYCFEYDVWGKLFKRKISDIALTDKYQRFILPVIYSKPSTVKYRLGFLLSYQKGRIFIDDVSLNTCLFFKTQC